jgi:sugar lactone lactonase YvrE
MIANLATRASARAFRHAFKATFVLAALAASFLPGAPVQACHHHNHGNHNNGSNEPPQLETIALFDPAAAETPENLAIDSSDNIYVNLALTGEIRRIAPDGTQSTFAQLPLGGPPGTPCGSFVGGLTGMAIDRHDNLYVALASCDADARGIWKIAQNGAATQLAHLPMESLPNGVALRNKHLYVADSALGVIWRVHAKHAGTPEIWFDHLCLAPVDPAFPGANGAQFLDDELYVSNSSAQEIIAIPVRHDGTAGQPRVHASGVPCDDFALDVQGAIYCGTDPFNTLVRIDPDGSSEVLFTHDDGLDGPTSAIFGRSAFERKDLFITNGAFPFFGGPSPRLPSLLRVKLDVAGEPRP